MAALVETMFSTRVTPWHGLGEIVAEAPTSEEAIRLAGLDWDVVQQKIYLQDGTEIEDAFANVRSSDNKPLGIVGNRYQIVQNVEAFSFTDALLGEGVKYETAGSLKDGKTIWLLAKLPDKYDILGDKVDPYIVFTNTHDGSGAVRVAMTPVRVVCNNTLNMALKTATRTWTTRHTGDINKKLVDAQNTLQLAQNYMEETKELFEQLNIIKMNDISLQRAVNNLIPIVPEMTARQQDNAKAIRSDIITRYNEAPDLVDRDKTGARFIQAVADTTSHIVPLRLTRNYKENKFKKTIDGNEMLDKAIDIIMNVA